MSRNHFNKVGGLKPRRNLFDLSYHKTGTCGLGDLYPVMCDEVVPGDHFTIGAETIVRFMPMVAPIMHEVDVTTHYFFVSYRILWDKWEEYISQGTLDGSGLAIELPRIRKLAATNPLTQMDMTNPGTLWDAFGFPLLQGYQSSEIIFNSTFIMPMDMPWRAYNRIWNEYYRDQDLQSETVEVPLTGSDVNSGNFILKRNWKKDYFTASRPFRQKGQAPALPVDVIFNTISVPTSGLEFPAAPLTFGKANGMSESGRGNNWTYGTNIPTQLGNSTVAPVNNTGQTVFDDVAVHNAAYLGINVATAWNMLQPLLSAQSSTFDVSDLRLAFQVQKWLERNARAGTRYTEFLRSHFGVSPNDSRLDRPEYIGGTKAPVIINEILQTGTTGSTAQSTIGAMKGHGLSADSSFVGKYHVQEFGIIIGLMSVMPKPQYYQGMPRQWSRITPVDFYFPEYAHLSEQAILQQEIMAHVARNAPNVDDYDNQAIFGYTGQYDEMRTKQDMVTALMRPGVSGSLGFYHFARQLSTDKANPPNLNSTFITCVPDKRPFVVTTASDATNPPIWFTHRNLIRAARPMPLLAEPGLIDHN